MLGSCSGGGWELCTCSSVFVIPELLYKYRLIFKEEASSAPPPRLLLFPQGSWGFISAELPAAAAPALSSFPGACRWLPMPQGWSCTCARLAHRGLVRLPCGHPCVLRMSVWGGVHPSAAHEPMPPVGCFGDSAFATRIPILSRPLERTCFILRSRRYWRLAKGRRKEG